MSAKVWDKRRAKQRQGIAMKWCVKHPDQPYSFRTGNGWDVTMTVSFNHRDLIEEDEYFDDDVWDED